MSLCKRCGVEVRWAQRDNGRAHPPLEYIGPMLYVDSDNVVRATAGYKAHICSDADMTAWETEVNQQSMNRMSYLEAVERAQQASRVVVCRRCNSDVDVVCKNLTERKKGREVDTRWPHTERLEDVGMTVLGVVSEQE